MTVRTTAALMFFFASILVGTPIAIQAQEIPLTTWGAPNLNGVWDFRTVTPLERPAVFADREKLTEEEAAALEAGAALVQSAIDRPPPKGSVGAYNAFWLDFGTTVGENRRTSLIVDPPDGQLPPLGEDVGSQFGSLDTDLPGTRPVRIRSAGIGADGPEDRGLAERCLMGFNSGPPMMPSAYNNNMQLFQSSDYVVILNEMVHDARVIPLDSGTNLPEQIRQWMGDSRGHWEGNTLVVETRNFTDKTGSFDLSALSLRLTERFTRIGEETLLYEYTVQDPVTFTRPFTVALPMKRSNVPIFEYACHEGNYGMVNLLSGARTAEKSDQ